MRAEGPTRPGAHSNQARHGHGAGSVTLGGRRIPVERPRMRAVEGTGELPVPACEVSSDTEILGRMAMERMLAGLSTRRYLIRLQPVGARIEQKATSTSKSAVENILDLLRR
jgi:putative transposase